MTAFIVGAIFFAFGAFIIGIVVREMWRAHQSRTWPRTMGTILALGTDDAGDGSVPVTSVVYEYEMRGVRHRSQRVHFGELWPGFILMAMRPAEGYLPNSSVVVYYHPGKPSTSVLEPGVKWAWPFTLQRFLLILFGLMWIAMAVNVVATKGQS